MVPRFVRQNAVDEERPRKVEEGGKAKEGDEVLDRPAMDSAAFFGPKLW
jgi:hypothetical protein